MATWSELANSSDKRTIAVPSLLLASARAGLAMEASATVADGLAGLRDTALRELVGQAIGDGSAPDCEAALPHLRALQANAELDQTESSWLTWCQEREISSP